LAAALFELLHYSKVQSAPFQNVGLTQLASMGKVYTAAISPEAVGDPEGVAELMVFYCEQAAEFCSDVGSDNEGYFDALVRMFEQALKFANALSPDRRDDLVSSSRSFTSCCQTAKPEPHGVGCPSTK
jgi:hypothetical protein